MKKQDLQSLVQECISEVLEERKKKSKGDDEFKRVDKGVKGKVAKDKGEEEVYGAGYAAGEINTVLNPLVGTLATVVINPNGTATSSTNPAWTATVLVNSVSPVAGAVGDLATFSVTYPTSGSVTFAHVVVDQNLPGVGNVKLALVGIKVEDALVTKTSQRLPADGSLDGCHSLIGGLET